MRTFVAFLGTIGCLFMASSAMLVVAATIGYLQSHPPQIDRIEAFVADNMFSTGAMGVLIGLFLVCAAVGIADRYGK